MDYKERYYYEGGAPRSKSHRTLWMIFFGVLFVGIFLGVYFVLMANAQKSISENKLVEGSSVELEPNRSVRMKFGNDEEHSLKVNFVGLDSADITIQSDPINLSLKVGETKEVDLDDDGVNDLKVRLVSINEGRANLGIKRIGADICREEWVCSEWSECSEGWQTRECEDLNDCGTDFDMPEENRVCSEDSEDDENENISGEEIGDKLRNETRDRVNNLTNVTNKSDVRKDKINESLNGSEFDGNWSSYVETRSQIDCGKSDNYSCFINASEDCHPAVWNRTFEANVFGIITRSVTHFELRGYSSEGECVYYEKILDGENRFSDGFKQDLREEGYTKGEIEEMEKDLEEDSSFSIGSQKICKYEVSDLLKMMGDASEGSFSTANDNLGECYPHDNFECKLDFSYYPISGLGLGGEYDIRVEGFSDAGKVTWETENSSVASWSKSYGSSSVVSANKVGSTYLTVKDTSLDSCQLRWKFEVTSDEEDDSQNEDYLSDCMTETFSQDQEINLRGNSIKYFGSSSTSDSINVMVNGEEKIVPRYENKIWESSSVSVGYLDSLDDGSVRLNVCFDAA